VGTHRAGGHSAIIRQARESGERERGMAIVNMAMWRKGEDLTQHQRQSFANVLEALGAGGFAVAVADVYQGSRLEGTFSHTPVDFQGLDDVAEFAGLAIRAGVRFWPMVNPFGVDPEGEAKLHAEAARRVSERIGEAVPLVVDYEYRYDGFFGVEFETGRDLFPPQQGLPRTQNYFAHLRHELGGLPVFVCPDPRQVGRDYPLSAFPPDAVLLLQMSAPAR
jgi:hypothetical protein